MLETNVNNFSEENKAHADLKTETKENDTSEKIEDNAIRIISVHSKLLKDHAEKLREELNYALQLVIIQNWLIERKSTKSLIFKKALIKQS